MMPLFQESKEKVSVSMSTVLNKPPESVQDDTVEQMNEVKIIHNNG
jgi:hypothetical protein